MCSFLQREGMKQKASNLKRFAQRSRSICLRERGSLFGPLWPSLLQQSQYCSRDLKNYDLKKGNIWVFFKIQLLEHIICICGHATES